MTLRLRSGQGVLQRVHTWACLATVLFACERTPIEHPSHAYPHQPAGFVPIAEHRFSCNPDTRCAPLGTWTAEPGGLANFRIVPDPTAPQSPESVGQTLFPIGQPAGIAPVWFDGWGQSHTRESYRKLYVSLWVRIVGPNFENQAVGTKMGFIGYGEDPNGASNQGFAMLVGTGVQSVDSAFRLGFWQQNHVSRELGQNLDTTRIMTAGPWHHWEMLLELNHLGVANGTFRWWVDGKPIMRYADVVYVTPGNTFGFYNYRWNPTWGGQGGIRTRDDFIRLDHLYLSGQP